MSAQALQAHTQMQDAAQRELMEGVTKVHDKIAAFEERERVSKVVTQTHTDNRKSVVEHLTHAHFHAPTVHNVLNAYSDNSTRENNLHVHIHPTTGEATAQQSTSSSSGGGTGAATAHPSKVRQLANDLEFEHLRKHPKTLTDITRATVPVEPPPVAQTVAVYKEDLKKKADKALDVQTALHASKKPKPTQALEDRPAKVKGEPSITDGVKEQVKPAAKAKAKAKATGKDERVKGEPPKTETAEPRGRRRVRTASPLPIEDRKSRTRSRNTKAATARSSSPPKALEDAPPSKARGSKDTFVEVPTVEVVERTGNKKKKEARSASEPPKKKAVKEEKPKMSKAIVVQSKKSTINTKGKYPGFTVVS